ncbi:hypothetical protein [Tessaracoccus sp.]
MGKQDVANTIVNTITDFMHGDASAHQGGKGSGMQGKLDAVASACETAIQRDETEAAIRWAAAAALGPITAAFTASRIAFDSKAGSLTSLLRGEVTKLRVRINTDITPHLGAPAKLLADAAHWEKLSSRVRGVQSEVVALGRVSGWNDDASPEYLMATQVQAKALSELNRVMAEVGGSCQQGAVTNRAGFAEVEQLLGKAAHSILGLGSGGGTFFARTAGATTVLFAVQHMVKPQALSAYKMGMKIDQYVDKALSTTDLPAMSWPTGTSGAGIADPSTSG